MTSVDSDDLKPVKNIVLPNLINEAKDKHWEKVSPAEWESVKLFIHTNDFDNSSDRFTNPLTIKLLSFYENNRKFVIEKGTELFVMKQEYDKNPILEAKRHGKKKE